ncbi:hypothetical protein [Sphingomonas sp.]|uniref:hypothetical protein n=1 Tax=Sphingomonas sp. TaxID=28214 RepID=UPI003D6D4F25
MSSDEKNPSTDPHASAASAASQQAGQAVPGSEGLSDELNALLLDLKRKIAASPPLQNMLHAAEDVEDFFKRLIGIGAAHSIEITPEQCKAFIQRRNDVVAANVGTEPPPSSQTNGCTEGNTCQSLCTVNPYNSGC